MSRCFRNTYWTNVSTIIHGRLKHIAEWYQRISTIIFTDASEQCFLHSGEFTGQNRAYMHLINLIQDEFDKLCKKIVSAYLSPQGVRIHRYKRVAIATVHLSRVIKKPLSWQRRT